MVALVATAVRYGRRRRRLRRGDGAGGGRVPYLGRIRPLHPGANRLQLWIILRAGEGGRAGAVEEAMAHGLLQPDIDGVQDA